MAFVVRGKSGNIVGRYATQAEAERRIAQLRAGAVRLRPFQFASGSLTQTEARNQAWSPTGEGRAAGLRRRNLGEIMAPWGSDFSYKAGPVGAVSSLYFAGEIYPDRTMVERALALIEANIVPAMRGENGWTKKDVADLQFIAAGLRYYLARDYKGQHSWPGKPRRHAHAARLGQRRAARSPTQRGRKIRGDWFVLWSDGSENGPFDHRSEAKRYADNWNNDNWGGRIWTFKIVFVERPLSGHSYAHAARIGQRRATR